MALIPCYECYKEISEKTPTCPHCGASKDESPFTDSRSADGEGGRVSFSRWGGTLKFDGPYQDFIYEIGKPARLVVNAFYKDGKGHGPCRFYTEDGKLETEGGYDMGEKCGEWQHYHRTAIFRTLKVETSTHPPCPPGLEGED